MSLSDKKICTECDNFENSHRHKNDCEKFLDNSEYDFVIKFSDVREALKDFYDEWLTWFDKQLEIYKMECEICPYPLSATFKEMWEKRFGDLTK